MLLTKNDNGEYILAETDDVVIICGSARITIMQTCSGVLCIQGESAGLVQFEEFIDPELP